jgi:hypothetical protein
MKTKERTRPRRPGATTLASTSLPITLRPEARNLKKPLILPWSNCFRTGKEHPPRSRLADKHHSVRRPPSIERTTPRIPKRNKQKTTRTTVGTHQGQPAAVDQDFTNHQHCRFYTRSDQGGLIALYSMVWSSPPPPSPPPAAPSSPSLSTLCLALLTVTGRPMISMPLVASLAVAAALASASSTGRKWARQ